MAGRKPKTENKVTPNKIIAWVENKAGKPQSKVADDLGVSQATISGWVGEIDEFIKESPQYAEIAPRLAKMIPSALTAYDVNLNKFDLNAARDVLKMIGVFVEKSKRDVNHGGNVTVDFKQEVDKRVDNLKNSIGLADDDGISE